MASGAIAADGDQEDSGISTKLPIKQMVAIFFCQMNEATQITMPYTIAVYMVRDYLGPEASQAQISRLTGVLAACFCAAQFLSSIPLGYLSDTYGRKPIVIMSNISSLISVLGFGASTTYLSALLTRMSGGLCNFTFGCLKSMIGESMDLPTQALALGYLSLSWGFGTILGPSLGGALATPCEAYGTGFPLCQPGQLFQTRPFLLPCISAAFISFLALQSSMFLLKETLPSKVARKYSSLQQADEEQGMPPEPADVNDQDLELHKLSGTPERPPTTKGAPMKGGLGRPRQVRRGDSAEEMHAHSPGKQHSPAPSPPTSPMDELSPLAGTVGIELVPQSLALMAGKHTDSMSATQQRAASSDSQAAPPPPTEQQHQQQQQAAVGDTQTVSTPLGVGVGPQHQHQQQQTQVGLQQTSLADDSPSGGGALGVNQQSRQVPHSNHSASSTDAASEEAHATTAVDTEDTSQQGLPLQQHQSCEADSSFSGRESDDDEHAVLIAASEDQPCDSNPGQMHASNETQLTKKQSAAAERQRVWYKERAVQLTILGYGSIAFLYNFVDELTPLFAAAPPAIGGVGLLASQLAVPLVFCGVVLMVYAVYGYPWFQRTYGAKVSCRLGLIATAPFVLLIPIAHYFSWSVISAQLTLCAILAFKSMGASNSFSGSMILVNNAAPRHALGKVNGAGQMVASFVRAIGPAMAGVIWGSTTQLDLPGKQFLPFAFVAVVSFLTQFVYLFVHLPSSDR